MKSDIVIIVPATDYDLVSLEDVLSELQITGPTDADKTLLRKQIASISAAVSKYCDRVFVSEEVEETLWEPRDSFGLRQSFSYFNDIYNLHRHHVNSIYLKRWPITSIDSIYVDDIALVSDSNSDILRIDKDNGVLYHLINGFPARWHFGKSVVVTYTGGYTTIPEDLQRAVIRWVEMAWFFAGQDVTIKNEQVYGIASVTYGTDTTTSKTADVPDEIKLLLEPYLRNWWFA